MTANFSHNSKPRENPFIESFNIKRLDECLNIHVFITGVMRRIKK
ncbi:TPA: transposase [Enterobacter hormaechei]|nr:transposase [Enterobacter hormaechei]